MSRTLRSAVVAVIAAVTLGIPAIATADGTDPSPAFALRADADGLHALLGGLGREMPAMGGTTGLGATQGEEPTDPSATDPNGIELTFSDGVPLLR